MKIINLGRGRGKTVRLLYASEWNDIPILCATHAQKDYLKGKAKDLGLIIPEPVAVSEITSGRTRGSEVMDKDILIDEAPLVLQNLLSSFGINGQVKAITLTSDELK